MQGKHLERISERTQREFIARRINRQLGLNGSYIDMVEQFMTALDSQRSGLLYRLAKQTVRHCLVVMSGVLSLVSLTNSYAEDTPGNSSGNSWDITTPSGNPSSNSNSWNITLGAGVGSAPKYPGSDTMRTRVMPLIDVNYGRFFLGPGGLGVNLYQDGHWRLAATGSFGFSKLRQESDDPHLQGLGDIDATPRAGVLAGYHSRWFAAGLRVNTDVGGHHQGTVANFEFDVRYPVTQQLTLSAGPRLTWADSSYMQTVFGVDATQARNSGLPQYTASGGISEVSFGVGARYRFTSRWIGAARVSVGRLQGDAAASPITEKLQQRTFAMFVVYHF